MDLRCLRLRWVGQKHQQDKRLEGQLISLGKVGKECETDLRCSGGVQSTPLPQHTHNWFPTGLKGGTMGSFLKNRACQRWKLWKAEVDAGTSLGATDGLMLLSS